MQPTEATDLSIVVEQLKSYSSPVHFAKLAHFGINTTHALGVKMPDIRQLAKTVGKNHKLAIELWNTQIHEARMLASMIADPALFTETLFDNWVGDFDSWDVCDTTCDVLAKTAWADQKIEQYANDPREFVKRTAFVLMCEKTMLTRKSPTPDYERYFELIKRESWDDRNFVRKAVNWALRHIGKRSESLRIRALEVAEEIKQQPEKAARWIAADAIRELNSPKIIEYLKKRNRI